QVELAPRRGQKRAPFGGKAAHKRAADHPPVARHPDALSGERIGAGHQSCRPKRMASAFTVMRSEATISFTMALKEVLCFHPSALCALRGSPSRRSTSVGRK